MAVSPRAVTDIIATNLRVQRARSGRQQCRVAVDLHMSQPTLSSYEHGRTRPDLARLIDFCLYYGCALADIISEELFRDAGPNERPPDLTRRRLAGDAA